MKRFAFFLSMTGLLLLALACTPSSPEAPETPEPPESSYDFLSDAAPSALTKTEQEKVAKINGFAFAMAKEIGPVTDGKSYVYSPVSISYALGLLANGAAGKTKDEITAVLGFGNDGLQDLNEFNRDLMVISGRSISEKEILEVANAVLVRKDVNIYEKYKESIKNYYNADLFVKDFAEGKEVAEFVNKWADQNTHGRIKHVLNDNDVRPSMVALLMNALYFKAAWYKPFDKIATAVEPFTAQDGSKRTEKMMKKTEALSYYKNDKFAMVSLPYGYEKDYRHYVGNYSMSLILPAEGIGVDNIIGSMDGKGWADAQASLASNLVEVWLPRFDIDFNMKLNDCFRNLGMNEPFSAAADFSAMSDTQMFVSFITQVANISVDEEGTEAAAVTVIGMDNSAGPGYEPPKPIPFHCDRPFIFAITEKTTGAILFMGCYK
ncbi:MAG: serpin family protein [Bacteroidales bacterium]|nr:serpin family protein [Bacteroidales bacterium]